MVRGQRTGSALMMVGKVLLWMDLLLLAFVYVGLRGGSRMWLYWVLGQALVAVVLLVIGFRRRGSLSGPERE